MPYANYNFDEGVYTIQAQKLWSGQQMYKDFFYHQPPAYLWALAPFTGLFDNALFSARFFSFLCYCFSAILVFFLAAHFKINRVFTLGLFLFVALGAYGRLALPESFMLLLTLSAVTVLWLWLPNTKGAMLAALLMVLAILTKPISISSAFVIFVLLIVQQRKFKLALTYAGGGFFFSFLLLFFINQQSDGALLQLISAQLNRFNHTSGFEMMKAFDFFAKPVAEANITSALGFNLLSHKNSFFSYGVLNTNLILLGFALYSSYLLIKSKAFNKILFYLIWLGICLFFNLFIWEPVWDHYFLQYLPPLCLLAGSALGDETKKHYLIALFIFISISISTSTASLKINEFKKMRSIDPHEQVVSFNTVFYVATNHQPMCKIDDPFNTYGPWVRSFWQKLGTSELDRFHISSDDLIACLGRDEKIKVYIDSWALDFLRASFNINQIKYLKAMSPTRFIFDSTAMKKKTNRWLHTATMTK